jgi:hypothetical protein
MLRSPFLKKLAIWIGFHAAHDVILLMVGMWVGFPVAAMIGGVLAISTLTTLLSTRLEKRFR